ncbi:hypothetical protein Baya_5551 [Bagarius yarrelli]|uniref:Uncharacterized protein n=1 Tax=Bagarius yarrelli TaxID=175774 RepID=A0A556TV04_BAGYA|nr:hypothetical protein Baya_5551 [Bagarius yarrelli]
MSGTVDDIAGLNEELILDQSQSDGGQSVIIGAPLVRHVRDGPQDKARKLQTQRLLQHKHIYSLEESDTEPPSHLISSPGT